ncbi:ABC transporter permease [Pontibacter fetidus]|uniref:ABC transporter permease n=1 Tax=Pontibacter fetidus TaxID=2700082 RepID=A0A6B2GYE2_9BACT|nr:ABC transporter permease [Pontibacter fetidus]NDK55989.1 ABC transporter permease [Pontibacter fetidus]
MKALLQDIAHLWQTKWSFRLALLYLAGLGITIALLPFIPLPFTPDQLDLENVFLAPFNNKYHVLGTDQLGRDVLVNTLYGARNGLLLALPVMAIASLVGVSVGVLAGYFGNNKQYLKRGSLLVLLCCLSLLLYYNIIVPLQLFSNGLPSKLSYTSMLVGVGLSGIAWFGIKPVITRFSFCSRQVAFPLDSLTLRTIELISSLPRLLILISVAAFMPPSVMLLSVIFICTYWTGTARLARAEMLRIAQLPFIEAATTVGMTHRQIIFKEAVPNLLSPVVVAFVFGVGSLLAIESTLSFLGIGLPADLPSWGRTIAGIRSNLGAWWLVAFPGGFLALTVLALQVCSYHLVHITQGRARQ